MSALGQFNHIRTLRKEAKEMGAEEFLLFAEKVDSVRNEITEELEAVKAKQALVEEKVKSTAELLQSEGFDVDVESLRAFLLKDKEAPTVSTGKGGKGGKRGSVEPKYAFTDENGEEKTWTGRGRTPKALEAKLSAGASIEDFLINKN